MEERDIQKPAGPLDATGEELKNNSNDINHKPFFAGLNLKEMVEQIKASKMLYQANHGSQQVTTTIDHCRQVDVEPEKPMFNGLHLEEAFKIFNTQIGSSPVKKSTEDNLMSAKPPSPEIRLSKIRTEDVITSLIKVKTNKRVKVSTLATYEKRLLLFQQKFDFLPENPEAIMDYLSRFDGESGRHRRNQQDLLNMLYEHAIHRFGLPKNPVAELERPIVTRKPIKTLSLEQIQALNQTPENLLERTALDLLKGHGWRQIELRRVQAKDVAAIDHQLILCHGKERQELAPVLPETVERLREMARDLAPDDFLFVARQKRHGHRAPLGEDGMSQLIGRLLARAGIRGFTGHDLRRTFATLVTAASHDEFLAMRLLRDRVPGQGDRYVRYPMAELAEALQKYSPVRQAEESTPKGDTAGVDIQKVSTAVIPENVAVETVEESGGDGGESNSPSRRSCPGHPTGLVNSLILPGPPQLTELSQASR